MKRIIVWVVLALIAAGAAALLLWPRAVVVETVAVERGPLVSHLTEEAETLLDNDYIVAMPVSGRLLRIDLKEGYVAERGEMIARVDTFEREKQLQNLESRVVEIRAQIVGVDKAKPKPEDIRAAELAVEEAEGRLAVARKALEAARVDYEQERKQYERRKALFEGGAISQSLFDEYERNYLVLKAQCDQARLAQGVAENVCEQAEVKLTRLRDSIDDNEYQRAAFLAQIEQAETQMAVLRDEIARSEIKAPVRGPVLEKYQENEQVLAAGTPILKLGDMESIRVMSDVLSEEIGRVHVGDDAEIYGPAVGEKPVPAEVERIYPGGFEKISSLGIEQQRVKVIFRFDNAELQLRPGVRVDVRVVTDRKADALLVPERALFKESDSWALFVLREGQARLTPVGVGLRGEDRAEVVSGVEAGDVVIVGPPPDLKDGDRCVAAEADRAALRRPE